MKRQLLSAAVIAMFAGPGLAQTNTGQDHVTVAPARPSNAPAPRTSAPPTARTFAPPAGRAPIQGFAPAYRQPPSNAPGSARAFVPGNPGRPTPGGQNLAPNQTYRAPGTPTSRYGAYRSYQGAGQTQSGRRYQGPGQHQGANRPGGDWWRGHRGFEPYHGHRSGYWFAPGWGYYQVDPQWYGYDWEVGAEVPYDLRGYYVSDPYDYGLPPAPYGCAWIFLGDQIVLIDLQSGDIVQIAQSY